MILNNNKLAECIYYAIEKHGKQKDYSGIPYIVHLISVTNMMENKKEKIVAVLHDIIEDTNINELQLISDLDLPAEIIDAITAITHRKNESNSEYIDRVRKNSLASKVKLADLKSNMDLTRMKDFDQELIDRLNKKHVAAYRQLIGE